MQPIAIFGGTFDPIHLGHLRCAWEVGEWLAAERVHFVPSACPVHRGEPAVSSLHRLRMVELAIAAVPGWLLDDRELQRGGPSYMVDTLRELRGVYGPDRPLCLVLGSDAFEGFLRWHDWRGVLSLANLVVMTRAGVPAQGDEPLQRLLQERALPADAPWPAAGAIVQRAVTAMDVSATHLRALLAQGLSVRFLVPDAVAAYIERHDLYRLAN